MGTALIFKLLSSRKIRGTVTCSIPDYKESCTSVFTEESCLTGDFCPSISGIVNAPAVDSSATACFFKTVGPLCRYRPRLRELRLLPEEGLAWAGGGWMVLCIEPLILVAPLVSFPERFVPIHLRLHPSIPHLSLLCCTQCLSVFMSAILIAKIRLESSVLTFLLTLTIPSSAC